MRELRFRRANFDAEQLRWDLEDLAGVKVGANFPGEYTEGHLNTSGGTDISVCLYEAHDVAQVQNARSAFTRLSLDDIKARIERVVGDHEKREWRRGGVSGAVTRYSRSTGRLIVRLGTREKAATCFLYGATDSVLTAAHVIGSGWEPVAVEFEGHTVSVKQVLQRDDRRDIAKLQLDRPMRAPVLVVRHPLSFPQDLGMRCAVVGFPDIPLMFPSQSVYDLSVVSVKHNYTEDHHLLELSTHLGSGISGSPVLNERFSLVGMITGYPAEGYPTEGDNWPRWTPFAVSSEELSAWS